MLVGADQEAVDGRALLGEPLPLGLERPAQQRVGFVRLGVGDGLHDEVHRVSRRGKDGTPRPERS
jgi:hypothetical protein